MSTEPKRASLSIIFSTREIDQRFIDHIKNTVGVSEIEIIHYVNKKQFSLAELYNKGLQESKYDIVVFIHDDVIFNNSGWGYALVRQFWDSDYGILGVAGTSDLVFEEKDIVGSWWFLHHGKVGKIKYNINNKSWDDIFSNSYKLPIQVVCLDGVFLAVDKRKLQRPFDERFKGFHYYDISFSFANHLAGVKVGVTFEIDLIHKSSGKINSEWHQNRLLFSECYRDFLPCGVKPEKIEYDVSMVRKFDLGKSIISIIIPTKNKINLIMDCIQSIVCHTRVARYEILIADTGSTAENKDKLLAWIKNLDKGNNLLDIKIIEYDYYSFAKINNDVVKNHLLKKSSHILFCNNDIKLLNDAVDRCLSFFKQGKNNIGTVGIRLHYADNSIQHNGIEMLVGFGKTLSFSHRNLQSYHTYDSETIEVIGNTAAFLMIERSVFEKFYFNEDYEECYEDVELNLEMLRLGRKNYNIGHAVAYHYESQTRNLDSDKDKRLMEDYQKNLLPYFKRNCVPLFIPQLFEGASRASRLGYFETALEICQMLLTHLPRHPDVHHLLGVILDRQGDQAGAVQAIRRAIELNDKQPTYHHNLGGALFRQGDPVAAERSYRQALRLAPQLAETHVSLANVLREQGRLDEAFACYQRALQLKPDYALAYHSLGNALLEQGNYAGAADCYQRVLQLRPDFAEAYNNLGQALDATNRLDEAAEAFRQALRYKPDLVEARRNLGTVLERQGLSEDARTCYQAILAREPADPLLRLRVDSLCPAIPVGNPEIDKYRAGLMARLGQLCAQPGLRLDPRQLHASGFEPPLYLAYQGRDDRPLKEAWAALFQSLLPEVAALPPTVGGKPRVGFVVTRGHEGIFAKCMRGILNGLPARRFELTVVCGQQGGEQILRAAIANPDVRYLPLPVRFDRSLEAIRQARFDILYYWEVGTDSVNYFLPFFRLAPIQCTGWVWPVTSGIAEMDYFLSSQHLETPEGDTCYRERLVRFQRLPACFYRPEPSGAMMGREHFGLSTDQHIYLCVQNLRKLHPDFDGLMDGILRRDPRGLVVLIEDTQPLVTAQLRRRLQANLPEVIDRICFLARLPHGEYLNLLSLAEVILDTVHFGGGVTAYEAFSVGKPVVTLPGEFSRGRLTYAAYRQMGLDDGIAADPEDYIERALRFATEPDYRVEFGHRLREASAELFEDQRAVREFEGFVEAALTGGM
ncbi:MAG: tetratricopeptide repeat protein [Candidatus Competibacter sp.]